LELKIKMIPDLLKMVFLQLCVTFGSLLPPATAAPYFGQPMTQRSGFKVREPNVHAPDLYADKIDFIATLVDLPGATKKQSYWELSYQIYFIPEDKYYEALKHAPRGPSNPTPEEFPGRMLLAEGHTKKTRLGTPKGRTITLTGVPFKQKVADALRTKFSHFMTAYSVKIFDAELNTTVYQSGIFLTEPFEGNQNEAVARKTLYLNFGVNPNGSLNYSQLPSKAGGAFRP
jgi:hypothetical protein